MNLKLYKVVSKDDNDKTAQVEEEEKVEADQNFDDKLGESDLMWIMGKKYDGGPK